MISAFFKRRVAEFRAWWQRPTKARDRVGGFVVGAMAGLWVGAIARLVLGEMPVAFSVLAEAAMIGAACGAALGVVFPKVVLVLGVPFALLGVGS